MEWFILPHLVSFIIFRLYINNTIIDEPYMTLYNTIKTYVNIIDENDYLIYKMTEDILKNHYHLKIVSLNPLVVSPN